MSSNFYISKVEAPIPDQGPVGNLEGIGVSNRPELIFDKVGTKF
jgi:hypothetical protein